MDIIKWLHTPISKNPDYEKHSILWTPMTWGDLIHTTAVLLFIVICVMAMVGGIATFIGMFI